MGDEWWLDPDDDDTPDDLTESQVDELVADLVALQADIQGQIDAPSDRTSTVDLDKPMGRVSRVDALQEQKMAQAQRNRLRGRLSQISVALKVAEADEYGECRRCGESIGYQRLKAAPEAPLCLPCAKSGEKR